MSNCPELKRLMNELEALENRLTNAEPELGAIQARIEELIRAIRLHREQHAQCDFKRIVQ